MAKQSLSIKVLREKEFAKLIKGMPDKLGKKAVQATFRKAASKHLTPAARNKVPVDGGMLKRSIGSVNVRRQIDGGFGIYWGVRTAKGKFDTWHAHLVERGTRPHKIKNFGAVRIFRNGKSIVIRKKEFQHPGTSPQPFIRPAWDDNKEKVLQYLADEVGNTLEKYINRNKP